MEKESNLEIVPPLMLPNWPLFGRDYEAPVLHPLLAPLLAGHDEVFHHGVVTLQHLDNLRHLGGGTNTFHMAPINMVFSRWDRDLGRYKFPSL